MIRVSSSSLLDPITNRLKDTTSAVHCVPLLSVSINQVNKLFVLQIGLTVHKHLIGLVKVVARVASRTYHDTLTSFQVFDGTYINGLRVVTYRGSQVNPEAISIDRYYIFHGKVKNDTNGLLTLVAYTIQPVTDFNEISSHCLEILRESLNLRLMKIKVEKIPNASLLTTPTATTATTVTATPIFHVPIAPPPPAGQVPISPNVPKDDSSSNLPTSTNEVNEPSNMRSERPGAFLSLNGLQSDILNLLVNCEKPEGLSKQEIREAFPGASLNEVQAAIDFLDFEAHIYPTIDEHHFKSVWD